MAAMHARRVWTPILLGVLAASPLEVFAEVEALPDEPAVPALPGTPAAKDASPGDERRPSGAGGHHGFYLRMGSGPAFGLIRSSGTIILAAGDRGSDSTVTYEGWGPSYELLLGGTVGPRTVLGAGVVGQRVWKPKVTMEHSPLRVRSDATFDDLGEGSINLGLIGPFFDWFPREGTGLHLGSMLGFALLGLNQGHTGVAASLWGGYDFWVSREWALGIEACFVALQSKHSLAHYSGTLDDLAINAALLFTALYY
jgi:hypothetical protein